MLKPSVMGQKVLIYSLALGLFGLATWMMGQSFWGEKSVHLSESKSQNSTARINQSSAQQNSPSRSGFRSIWQDQRLTQEGSMGRFNRSVEEQLRIESHVSRIEEIYQTGRGFDAAAELEKLIEEHPDVFEYRALLGYLYFQWDDYDLAVEHLEEAVRMDPDNLVVLNHLAMSQSIIGDEDSAVVTYNRILSDHPGNEEAIRGRMAAYEFQGRPERARAFLEEHYQAHRQDPGVATTYAKNLIEEGNLDRSLVILERTLIGQPDFFPAHQQLAVLKAQLGNFQEAEIHALEAYRSASSPIDKDHAASLYSELLVQQDRWDDYEDFVGRRLAENPNDIELQAQMERIRRMRENF